MIPAPVLTAISVVLAVIVLTVLVVLATRAAAAHRRKAFLPSLGPVVRIATPCYVVTNVALVPGTLALTPRGLVWDALFEHAGSATFERILRIETDGKLTSGRLFLRSGVLRVTLDGGDAKEFVVSRGHHWEWRQALGEWVAGRGQLRGAAV